MLAIRKEMTPLCELAYKYKTRNGISFGTALTKDVKPVKSFPEWGNVETIKKNYLI